MRKLLLATVAMLGGTAGLSGLAFAQAPAAPAPNPNLGTGVPFTATPGPTPQYSAGTFQFSSPVGAPLVSAPGPGTLTVRLNAKVWFDTYAGSDSGRNTGFVTTAAAATGPTITATNTKQADYSFGEGVRLFPGADGILANGLKYGGFVEVRQDNGEAPGGGVNGSISAGSRNESTLYVRVATIYVGTDKAGFVRVGSTYGASTLFITGTMENFDDGAWNGDLPSLFSGNTTVTWPFPDVGNIYTTDKIVYLSPQVYGFDFAASFAPNTLNGGGTPGNCPYSNTTAGTLTGPIGGGLEAQGCAATSSTSTGDYARPRNIGDAFLRYRGQFGPLGVVAEGGYIFSGKVLDNSTPAKAVQYNDYGIYDFGGQVTYGGLLVGAHVTGGKDNGQFNLDPKGVRSSFAYTFGASYAVGPFIAGASYIDYMSAGSKTPVSAGGSPWVGNRNEWGVALGSTYALAPGLSFYLSYLYGHRKENGVDLLSGVASVGATPGGKVYTHNNVQSQGVTIGTAFRW